MSIATIVAVKQDGCHFCFATIVAINLKWVKRIFVPTDLEHERTRLIKPRHALEAFAPESDEFFLNGVPERYAARPDSLENLCLADLAVEYDTSYCKNDVEDDVLPPEKDKCKKAKRITLKNKMGTMIKRSRRAVIRYHKFSKEKEPEKHYHSLMMLFCPWRNQTVDLLSSMESYAVSFIGKESTVKLNKQKFEIFSDEVEKNVSDLLDGRHLYTICVGQFGSRSTA